MGKKMFTLLFFIFDIWKYYNGYHVKLRNINHWRIVSSAFCINVTNVNDFIHLFFQ